MIVKIGTLHGWKLIDNVETFEINQTTHAELKQEEDIEQSGCPIGFMLLKKTKQPGDNDNEYIKVLKIWKRNNYFEKIVIDVNNVYILNDEGKTIERLN